MLPVTLQLPVAIILLCGGLLACFLGYRLFRFVLAVYGLVLGGMGAIQLVGPSELWASVATAIVGGVAGLLAFIAVYYVGVALVGAAAGALLVNVVWSQRAAEPHVLVVILIAIVGAFAALALQRYVIVVGTAGAGAWTAVLGGLALLGDAEATTMMGSLEAWMTYPIERASSEREVLVVWVVLALVGILAQLAQGRRKRRSQ